MVYFRYNRLPGRGLVARKATMTVAGLIVEWVTSTYRSTDARWGLSPTLIRSDIMFIIKYGSVERKGWVTFGSFPIDSLLEAKVFARGKIRKHLGKHGVTLVHYTGTIYDVFLGSTLLGIVTITKV